MRMQGHFLSEGICKLGIFLVFAQTILHLRPKSSYERYLKLLLGGMVLLQVFRIFGTAFEWNKALEWPGETLIEYWDENIQTERGIEKNKIPIESGIMSDNGIAIDSGNRIGSGIIIDKIRIPEIQIKEAGR